jgi:hypothetical protein
MTIHIPSWALFRLYLLWASYILLGMRTQPAFSTLRTSEGTEKKGIVSLKFPTTNITITNVMILQQFVEVGEARLHALYKTDDTAKVAAEEA